MKVAISGAGIAGPTLAYWLWRAGHTPTLVEKDPRLRTGGYVIDFWGPGYVIAERMGLIPAVQAAGYAIQEVRLVDRRGRKVGGFAVDGFRRNLNDRFTSLPRSDLAALIYGSINGTVETLV
jgi:2-polyprenyl-6-methoxyphenol hydroxylase-like FAD-dependent oxidoreductase